MKKILNLLSVLIFCGTVIFLSLKYCSEPQPETIITTDTITKTITEYKPKIIEKTKPVFIYDTIVKLDTIFIHDTVAVYLDYFTKYFYADTLLNDSTGFFAVYDTIYANSIYNRTADIKTYNKTKTVYKEYNELYFGGGFMYNGQLTYFIGLDYNYKKLIFGTGLTTDKQVLFKIGYKIK